MIRRSYKIRLYPNQTQEDNLQVWLDRCRDLYNACIEVKKNHWKSAKISLSFWDLQKELPKVKKECPEFKEVNAAVLQDVNGRVDKAYRAFFRRCKSGEKPGYPRFKSFNRYDSFTHPQAERCKWTSKRVYLSNFGWIRWKPWKDFEECTPKTLTFKREADGWYCIVSCELENPIPLEPTGKEIGIDLGLHNLVATSDGDFLGDLNPLKKAEIKLRKLQEIKDRKKKGSNRRKKAVKQVAKAYQHLTRAKKYQLDVISRKLVNENDLIAIEDLDLVQLTNLGGDNAQGRGLRRNFGLAAFGILTHMLTYKAEEAGRSLVKVDPRGTTQECSECGIVVPKDLSVRTHSCPHCGLILDRDTNAAKNVLKRGQTLIRITVPPAPSITLD